MKSHRHMKFSANPRPQKKTLKNYMLDPGIYIHKPSNGSLKLSTIFVILGELGFSKTMHVSCSNIQWE